VPREQALFGPLDPGEFDRILVISPHLDDAVLGAAHVLHSHEGSTVITVFAGRPSAYPAEPTPWDASGGFRAGDDVAALRRLEDRAALDVLGATPVWLDFVDHQYLPKEQRATAAEVSAVLEKRIDQTSPTAVFLPMGLANPDHVVAHEAALLARDALDAGGSERSWFCYEDGGYKHIPGMLAWRVAKLFRSGLWPTPAMVPVRPDETVKRRSIECYTSQLPPLREDHALDERLAAHVPEQYWRLAPPPEGWEGLMDA
jgi:LmbE family N-acetylglucosaminyl deacetylase